MRIGYIGFSPEMLCFLAGHSAYQVECCFCDTRFCTHALQECAEGLKIPLHLVSADDEIALLLEKSRYKIEFFVMYKTAIIIHAALLQRWRFYNFHPGSLETNRGAHPLTWTLLLGEPTAVMTLHRIEQALDTGLVIAEDVVPVLPCDDTLSLEARLEEAIPAMLDRLDLFLAGAIAGRRVEQGVYRPKIEPKYYTIDPDNDSRETMERKIRSQRAYEGAILPHCGRDFRCRSLTVLCERPAEAEGQVIIAKEDGFYIFKVRTGTTGQT